MQDLGVAQKAVNAALATAAQALGLTSLNLNSSDKVIGGIPGFDSLLSLETTRLVEKELGIKFPGNKSIFLSEDGKRALSYQETIELVASHISAASGKKATG